MFSPGHTEACNYCEGVQIGVQDRYLA
jgi:hypothetical protein